MATRREHWATAGPIPAGRGSHERLTATHTIRQATPDQVRPPPVVLASSDPGPS
jgi:hypothetical protein